MRQQIKALIAKVADKVSGCVCSKLLSAFSNFLTVLDSGQFRKDFAYALAEAFALVISRPCALGLVGTHTVGIEAVETDSVQKASCLKTAVSMEETGKVQTVALDKTGTIAQMEIIEGN